jgi:putative spermidine/putrescine transport system substrate-binding protein
MVWDGNLYDLDVWAIVKGSKNQKRSLDFIAFTTGTKPLAGFQDVAYGPPRHSSEALLDPAVKPFLPSSHVAEGLKADGNFWSDYGESLGERFNQWLLK